MKNTIENAKAFIYKEGIKGEIENVDIGVHNIKIDFDDIAKKIFAYTDTVIQSETAALRSEIASLRSRLDDCKRKGITGERV